jgi:hypothetical protein
VATLVTDELVQQWFERTKLTVTTVPDELDQTAHDVVFGRVSQVYDVSVWVDAVTTPSLILRIMSMLIAAWMYEAQYSEDIEDTENNWGAKLERMAYNLIDQIVGLTLVVTDPGTLPTGNASPVFFPTDVQDTDGLGSERKFTMGKVF